MKILGPILEAREFAVRAHGDQKYGDLPYVVHLDEVADIVMQEHMRFYRGLGLVPAEAVVVAYVHDVLEDTPCTEPHMAEKLGATVARCAAALADPPGKNRRERKALLHARLADLDREVFEHRIILAVKAADRLANLRRSAANNPGLLKMYREEAPAFRIAVFRPGLCDYLWADIDKLTAGSTS